MKTLIVILAFVLFQSCSTEPEVPSRTKVKQWESLYPKMNSKMARMEELMNAIDRFLGSDDYTERLIDHSIEFVWLSDQCVSHAAEYVEGDEFDPFVLALQKVATLGKELSSCIKEGNVSEAESVLSELDVLRRKSHSRWVL